MLKVNASIPLVTVVTVTYNSSEYVRDAIESVLAQDYAEIEYIIGDDCSSDNTWDIISEYKDTRIIAYRNNENIGEYPNRNKAIRMARGKYLIFIDGDDYIYPHGIAYYVKHAERFPGVAFTVQQNYTNNVLFPLVMDSEECLRNYFFGKTNMLSNSFTSNFFNTRLLVEAGCLSEAYRIGDEEIRLRLMSQYPVLFVQGWVAWPRETPGQASSRIHDGTALLQLIEIVRTLIDKKSIKNEELAKHIMFKLKRDFAFYILSRFKRFSFGKAASAFRVTGFKVSDLIAAVVSRVRLTDKLSDYNPSNPLKQFNVYE